MVLVVPVSLTGQAGKCLKQTAEQKEMFFSQKRCSAECTTVTQMQVSLGQSCCDTQASIQERIGASRSISLKSFLLTQPLMNSLKQHELI